MLSKTLIVLWTILCIAGLSYHLWNLEAIQPSFYAEINRFGVEMRFMKNVSPLSYVMAVTLWLFVWNLFVVPTALIGLLFARGSGKVGGQSLGLPL